MFARVDLGKRGYARQKQKSTPGETRTRAHGSGGRCSDPLSYRGTLRNSVAQARQFRKSGLPLLREYTPAAVCILVTVWFSVQSQNDTLDFIQVRPHLFRAAGAGKLAQVGFEKRGGAAIRFLPIGKQRGFA